MPKLRPQIDLTLHVLNQLGYLEANQFAIIGGFGAWPVSQAQPRSYRSHYLVPAIVTIGCDRDLDRQTGPLRQTDVNPGAHYICMITFTAHAREPTRLCIVLSTCVTRLALADIGSSHYSSDTTRHH